jgi:hypothetical protein
MQELRHNKPKITKSGVKIYPIDYSLPMEYAPSINIPTIITADKIILDPMWEENYRKVYNDFHQKEHIEKNVDERVYVSLEKILKFTKVYSNLVGIQKWDDDEDHAAQHTCLQAAGYGSTYLSIYIYQPYSLCIEPSRPLMYPEDIYNLKKNKDQSSILRNPEQCNLRMQVIDTKTNTIIEEYPL